MANWPITLWKYSNNPLSSAQYSTLLTAAFYLNGLNGIEPKWYLFIWMTLVTCFSASACLTPCAPLDCGTGNSGTDLHMWVALWYTMVHNSGQYCLKAWSAASHLHELFKMS